MKTQVISFLCVLKNKYGHVLSTSTQSEVINCKKHPGNLQDLVLGLQNVTRGEKRLIAIKAERAYGFYDPALCGEIPRCELKSGQTLRVGDTLPLYSPERKSSLLFHVVSTTARTIRVEGNHPLAGQDLLFDVEILDARELQDDDESSASVKSTGYVLH